MSNEITIRFGGDSHIKVETLIDYLENFKYILYRINSNLGYSEDDLIIEVSPPENGSFTIKINPKYKEAMLKSLGNIVVGAASGLIVLWCSPKQDNITKDDILQIIEKIDSREKQEITKQVYDLHQDIDIKQTINNTYKIIAKDESVQSLDISRNENKLIDVPKSEFKKYIKEDSEFIIDKNVTEKVDIDEATIIVKTVHFEGNAKWAFIWKGYPIKASIKDDLFLNKLSNESFKRGDILKVRLKRRLTFNTDLNTFIVDEKSYEIVEVINHKSRTDNNNDDSQLLLSEY